MPPKNDPGYGTEYEILVPALFSLQFLLNPQIEDFNIEINAENFGNLDDLKIYLKYTSGKEENYAIQLKHKEAKEKNIQPGNFEAGSGDFSIEKYCKGYRDIKVANKEKFHYILFTNQNFHKSNIKKVKKFRMETFMDCPGSKIFDTGCCKENIFKFDGDSETSDLNKEFFSRFSVYVSQKNFKDVEGAILKDIFEVRLKSNRDTALRFIHFIRNVHNNIFTNKILHRDTLKYHFFDLLASPLIFELDSLEEHDETIFLFESAISQFDISLMQKTDEVLLKENWKSRDYNIDDEEDITRWARDNKFLTRTDIENVDKIKTIFRYCKKSKPLILDYNENTEKCIDFVLSLFNNSLKPVLFVDDPTKFQFGNKQVFKNLSDLKRMHLEMYEELVGRLKITKQGQETSLLNFISANEGVEELFSLQDLIYCMNGLKIGLSDEELPENYIPRHVVTKVLIDIQTASDKNPNDLFVISCKENLRCEKGITLDEYLGKYWRRERIDANIIVSTDIVDMNEIKQKIVLKNIHFLIHLTVKNESFFQLVSSSSPDSLEDLLQDLHIDEREIYKHFNKTGLEIISATPGMGKSTMMTFLEKTCPLNYWNVRINLRDYNYLFVKPRTAEDILHYHKGNAEKFEKYFFERARILWLFDGVDELSSDRINNVIKTVLEIRKLKHKIWLSTRQNFKSLLSDSFCINPIEIQEVSHEEQEIYIVKRLSLKYSREEITGICDKIFCNIHVINNRKILGVPLQLFIITQTFLDYDADEIKSDIFLLTNMYKHFFEGQFKHLVKKMKIENPHFVEEDFEDKLETYEIPALKACLREVVFNNLNVTLTERRIKKFENHGDRLGIIVKVSRFGAEVIFTFFHQTYAEYFAASWLSEYYERIDDKNFLFDPRYQNLKYFFDMILCEECPAHLAILYKNLDLLRKCDESEMAMQDSAGRSVLHLVFSSGESFPCYEIEITDSSLYSSIYRIKASKYYVADEQYKKLLECLSCNRKTPFLVRDRLMQKNALEYADELFSISSLAYIADLTELDLDLLQNCKDKTLLIFHYAIRFGYKSLLLVNPIKQNLTELLSKNIKDAIQITTFLHIAIENKQSEIVKFLSQQSLLSTIINIADSDMRTPLHLSVIDKQFEIFKTLLLSKDVDINAQDIDKMNPFFTALKYNQREFLDVLLVHKDLDVNVVGRDGISSLHLSVISGNLEILRKLLEIFKMDIDFQDKNGDSALHSALKLKFNSALLEIVKELLKRKPDLDLKNNHDETPLSLALQSNYKLLTQFAQINGAIDVNYQDCNGNSFLIKSVKSGSLEETGDLLRHCDLNVNLKDDNGATALHWASYYCWYSGDVNSLEIFKNLLKRRDLEINSRDLEGKSVLHWITGNIADSIEIENETEDYDVALPVEAISSCIRALKGKGIDVNSRDVKNKTPLLLASEMGYPEVVEEILKIGGSVDAVDFEGNCALHLAVSSELLNDNKMRFHTNISYDSVCLERNICKTIQVLLQNNINPNMKNISKKTPLHVASEVRNKAVIQELLNYGVKINEVDENGRTALHLAVFNVDCLFSPEYPETVALLIEKGSDINALDNSGKTPLHLASYLHNSNDIPQLLENGANVNLQDNEGNTALHLAVCSEWVKVAEEAISDEELETNYETYRLCIVKMLLDQSIDVGIRNNKGKTAQELAEASSGQEIVALFTKI